MIHTLTARALAALPISIALAGCAGNLGALGDILGGTLGGGGQNQIRAEVQSVDQNRQIIEVRTEDGRTGGVRYDRNTQVVYQQQQYPVTALERGDIVIIDVQQGTSGETYAGRITVEQSVQDRGGAGGQLQTLQGQVGQVDQNQGAFQLHTQHGVTLTVTLPYSPSSQTLDRFRRLRQGDHVTIEATYVSQNRVELYRFR